MFAACNKNKDRPEDVTSLTPTLRDPLDELDVATKLHGFSKKSRTLR
jgi:hypothetical protein